MIKNEFYFGINPQDIKKSIDVWLDEGNVEQDVRDELDFLMSEILIPIYEQETGVLIDV